MRERKNEILFIDGRSLGTLVPGSRKQKALFEKELERIAAVYRIFKTTAAPENQPGFAAVATIDQVREYNYALPPGRYVGSEEPDETAEPFEELFPELTTKLGQQMDSARQLMDVITRQLGQIEAGE